MLIGTVCGTARRPHISRVIMSTTVYRRLYLSIPGCRHSSVGTVTLLQARNRVCILADCKIYFSTAQSLSRMWAPLCIVPKVYRRLSPRVQLTGYTCSWQATRATDRLHVQLTGVPIQGRSMSSHPVYYQTSWCGADESKAENVFIFFTYQQIDLFCPCCYCI
jgi:hypothetical protein